MTRNQPQSDSLAEESIPRCDNPPRCKPRKAELTRQDFFGHVYDIRPTHAIRKKRLAGTLQVVRFQKGNDLGHLPAAQLFLPRKRFVQAEHEDIASIGQPMVAAKQMDVLP